MRDPEQVAQAADPAAAADRALPVVLLLLGFAMLLRAQPIWTMGQYQDDSVLSAWLAGFASQGKGLWDFSLEMFRSLVQSQGRVSPVSAFLVMPLWVWVEDNLFLYRVLQAGSQLVALAAFALFVRTLTRDVLAAVLCVALYVAFIEVRDFHDAAHSYFVLLPFVATVGWLACHYAVKASEAPGMFGRAAWMVVLFNSVGALSYELAAPFAALSCLILLLSGDAPWQVRFARAAVAAAPVAIMAAVGLVLKSMLSHYDGTKIGSMDSTVLGAALVKHMSGGVPLSYWWYDPHRLLDGLLLGTRSYPAGLLSAGALFAALAPITYVALVRGRAVGASLPWLATAGVVLLVIPPALIALTLKYQREAVAGVGYLQNALSYFGACTLLFVLLHLAVQAASRLGAVPMRAVAALAGLAVGAMGATALLSSHRVAQAVNENWRYPREQLEVWMHAVRPALGDAPRVVAVERPWLQRWETQGFVWQHWRLHGRFVTAAEAAAAAPREELTALRVPARPHPAALNLYLDRAGKPGGRIHAMVMSTSRARLSDNALLLSAGARSWPFPDEVRRGRHGYFYREISAEAPPVPLADFRLTLATVGSASPAAALEPPRAAALDWVSGRFEDGWVTERFALRNGGAAAARVRLTLWNPTAEARTYSLEGVGPAVRELLAGGAKVQRLVELPAGATLEGRVTPTFVPSALGKGPDDRKLGLRVDAEVARDP